MNLLEEFDEVESVEIDRKEYTIDVTFIAEMTPEVTDEYENESYPLVATESFGFNDEDDLPMAVSIKCIYEERRSNDWIITSSCRW